MNKIVTLVIALALIVLAIVYFESTKPERAPVLPGSQDIIIETLQEDVEDVSQPELEKIEVVESVIESKAKKYDRAKEISTPDGFINTDGITISDLVGKKVILVDFWTYSCINCIRTTPYLNSWYEKYKDKGLEIVGIHTPEFEFEKDYDNVARATEKENIKYPVVLDNDYSTWTSYQNRYWPRKYLIDIDGFIVYDHIGEGVYDETEKKIQEALLERNEVLGMEVAIDKGMVSPEDVEVVNFLRPRSPEIYFGAWRNNRLGNGVSGVEGVQIFTEPRGPVADTLYLSGEWNTAREFTENKDSGAKIIFKYKGEKVFLVAKSENGVNVRIMRDGVPIGTAGGGDVAENDTVFVKEERLYRIIEDPKGWGEHTLEIIVEDPGLQAFTFTFG